MWSEVAVASLERPHTARYPPCTPKPMADPPPPPSSRALSVGGAGISVQTAAVSSMRSSCENLWSASKSVVSPAGPPTANRAVRGTPASLLRLSCLAAPLRQGGKIRLSQPIIRRGTAGSTAGCTSPSDSAQYLRMLVVGDIRARSYATGQQSLGDETTDLARRSDTECCSTLRHRRVPRAALNLAEYTSRYHHASRRSGC